MALIRAQISYPFRTNLPRDVATNTLWFYSDEATLDFEDACDILQSDIADFIEAVYDLGIGSYIIGTGLYINFYDQSTPPPRVPYTLPIIPGGLVTTSTIVPTEVAAVLSFEAVPAPGVPQARRRGRIYLPGVGAALQYTASSATAPFFPRFSTAFLNDVTEAAEALLTVRNQVTSPDLYWGVYSPTTESLAPVAGGWVDESPDTQRRRSVDATSRVLWSSP